MKAAFPLGCFMSEVEFDETDRRRDGAFFGRRKGYALRSHQLNLMQTLLPVLLVDDAKARISPALLFGDLKQEIHIEIGFGGGEHLIARAMQNPDIGYIGCEAYVNGVAKLLNQIDQLKIKNIRIHPGDALEICKILPAGSIHRLYILYPDPWPKVRQRKRRIISDDNLKVFEKILKTGAELRFATDIDDYSAWTLSHIARSIGLQWNPSSSSDWIEPWQDWTRTRYEAKAIREGRSPAYFRFLRR